MTLPPPSIPDSEIQEVTLSAELISRELLRSRLFSIEGLELHLLPGKRFAPVADAVGLLRESTYRQQLSVPETSATSTDATAITTICC